MTHKTHTGIFYTVITRYVSLTPNRKEKENPLSFNTDFIHHKHFN